MCVHNQQALEEFRSRAQLEEKEMVSKEACPACAHYCGYCGGSGHPSCGCFVRGRACSALQEDVYHAVYEEALHQGLSDDEAEDAAYQASKAA